MIHRYGLGPLTKTAVIILLLKFSSHLSRIVSFWIVFISRVSPRQARSFCFGKRTQNHVCPVVALRVPCAVRQLGRLRNSLRSNSARRISRVGCTARPHRKAVGFWRRGFYCALTQRDPSSCNCGQAVPIDFPWHSIFYTS